MLPSPFLGSLLYLCRIGAPCQCFFAYALKRLLLRSFDICRVGRLSFCYVYKNWREVDIPRI